MTSVLARIIARYASGALVAYGLAAPETAEAIMFDPDVITGIGAGLAVASEGAYALAVKLGWKR